MAALTEDVQTFIVQALACDRKVSLLVRDVKAEFGVDVVRQKVLHYHPDRGSKGKRLAEKWVRLFRETRKAYDEGRVEVGIANQAYRLQLFQRGAEFYEAAGNYVLASELAEKAAKELGGAYTNKRELMGKGGGPIETVGLTVDQWRAQAAERRKQAESAMASIEG